MFESAILVIDRLISLLKTREEARKAYLKDVIEPLMQETEKAYEDIVKLLDEARSAVNVAVESSDLLAVNKTLRQLTHRRADFKATRDKIATLAKVYREHCDDSSTQEFFDTVSSLFRPNYGPLTVGALMTDLFELLAKLTSSPVLVLLLPLKGREIEDARNTLEECEKWTNEKWNIVCAKYAGLKIRLGTPLKIKSLV